MNQNNTLRIFHHNNTIELRAAFAKKAQNPNSKEFAFLQQVCQTFPTYTVSVREIKKNTHKESYKGLTYAYMRDYICTHEPDETREKVLGIFDEMILISRCHSQAYRYPVIKQWFLDKYKEIVTHGISDEEKSAA